MDLFEKEKERNHTCKAPHFRNLMKERCVSCVVTETLTKCKASSTYIQLQIFYQLILYGFNKLSKGYKTRTHTKLGLPWYLGGKEWASMFPSLMGLTWVLSKREESLSLQIKPLLAWCSLCRHNLPSYNSNNNKESVILIACCWSPPSPQALFYHSHPQLTLIHTEPMTSQRVRMMSTLMSWKEGPKNTHTQEKQNFLTTSPQFVAAPKMFAITVASCEWMNEWILIIIQSDKRKCVQEWNMLFKHSCAQDPRGDDGSVVEPLVWDLGGPQNRCLGFKPAGVQVWKPCQSLLALCLTCGCRRLVGWVCCLCFPKKHTVVCMCVCGFWVHSQAELLFIGAFNGTVHSMDGALVALHSLWSAFS